MASSARLLKFGLDLDHVNATRQLKSYLLRRPHSSPSLSVVRRLFDSVPTKDTILWTAMISAYSRSDQPIQSLHFLTQMLRGCSNPLPNEYTYASAARAVASCHSHGLARIVHAQILVRGFLSNVVVGTSVVGMYSKCDDVVTARKVFDAMPERSAVTWNSIVAGYVTAGMGSSALELFYRMRYVEHGEVDEFMIASVLTGCAMIGDLLTGLQVHCYFIKVGFEEDGAVMNALCNMYFRCREVGLAEEVIEGREGDVLSKIMMVKGYALNGRFEDVIRNIRYVDFCRFIMRDCSVFVPVLAACANLSLLRIGRQVHGFMCKLGYFQNCQPIGLKNPIIGSTLIDMYYKCCSIAEAHFVFGTLVEKDISHWNMMIVGSIGNGLIEEAQCFFDEMPRKNAISWTAMISGYTRHGMPQKGLKLLSNFCKESFLGEECCSIYTVSLDACSCLAALDVGRQLHALAIRSISGYELNNFIMLETALIDMYSKSSHLDYAQKIFDRMASRNVVSWTSMITAYASHGLAFVALEFFDEFLRKGLIPNEVTFVSILNACSHCGLVEDGIRYFSMMKEKYGITPRSDHCACLVDMLARAGKLSEAWSLLNKFKDLGNDNGKTFDFDSKDGSSILGALLSGCRLHGDLELGSKVAQRMLEKNHQSSDMYVSLSNVYAADEKWDKVQEVRTKLKIYCALQNPGYSRIPSRTS